MISIVIPTLNEKRHIGILLDSIYGQDFSEEVEVVVADAGSTDGTVDVIRSYQAAHSKLSVVPGGRQAMGRNHGARVSSGDPIFFIDADVSLPSREFLKITTEYFRAHELAIGATPLRPHSRKIIDHILVGAYNIVLHISRFIRPLGAMCIVASREAFEKSGGYPENVIMAEDHDFVLACRAYGRYRVLPFPAEFSVRRMEKEGRFGLLWKYLQASTQRVLFGPIKKFNYEYNYTDDENSAGHESH